MDTCYILVHLWQCILLSSTNIIPHIIMFSGMTISHRGTRSRSSSSVAATSNTVSNHNEPDDHPVADEQIQDVHLRGSPDLPPIIPNEQDRPLVEPQGKS